MMDWLRSGHLMEPMSVQQFALEITGFAVASGCEDAVLHSEISHQMDQFPLDMSKVTPIDVAVSKLLSQVLHA